jgi:hypothetical protein
MLRQLLGVYTKHGQCSILRKTVTPWPTPRRRQGFINLAEIGPGSTASWWWPRHLELDQSRRAGNGEETSLQGFKQYCKTAHF